MKPKHFWIGLGILAVASFFYSFEWLVVLIALLYCGFYGMLWLSCYLRDRWREKDMVFLQITMPKKDSKEDKEVESEQFSANIDFKEVLGVMDHLYASLNNIRTSRLRRNWEGDPFFSVELASMEGEILFFLVCPREVLHSVEKNINSFYPDAVVEQVEDYNIFTDQSVVDCQVLVPHRDHLTSFRTYQYLKSDPLNTIANAFSKLQPHEGAAIQFVVRPSRNNWQRDLNKKAKEILNDKKKKLQWYNPLSWIVFIWDTFVSGNNPDEQSQGQSSDRITQMTEEYSKSLEEKASSPGFHCVLRIVASTNEKRRSEQVCDEIGSAYSQFFDVRGNALVLPKLINWIGKDTILRNFIRRNPRPTWAQWVSSPKMILGVSELTSFFHLPNIKYNKIRNIKWQQYKIVPAPKNIPEEGLYLGINTYRGEKKKIFMKNEDRFRHFYIIGQTGTGKSSIIQLMARQDFHNGRGVCVIDPHGSLIEDLLPYIPRDRADDIIYFNPADTERPMGLNMLEGKTQEEKELIALDAMNMMVKMFGEEIFGPRIQDYFRNGCLTLMEDDEEGGAITDLVKLFTDEEWQKYKVTKVKNPIVRAFWEKQMAQTGQREKQEMIPYFAAKFGQFYTNSVIRNIVGQTRSSFDVGQCMNEGKILLMNLSKGLIGDTNSQLLGMIAVNKVQVAAMRRQQQSKEERKDFFLYIDEFQNFVTQSIESILSEARKYRLGLILAHQYIDQLEKDSKLSGSVSLKGAVFGNVGTMMMYKIGPQDAEHCAKEMAPAFSEQDLVNMDAFKGAMKLSVDTQPSQPFTIDVPKPWLDTTFPKDDQASEAYKQLSRLTYGRQKDFVDREILRRIG